jgi:hypothetical protein
MQPISSSSYQDLNPGWQLLGELELTVRMALDQTVSKWLAGILNPLNLHPDFAGKVLNSAQEAALRASQVENVAKFKHVYLQILVLTNPNSNKHDWGFFRIDKIKNESEQPKSDHMIEFYLYQERQ